MKSESDISHFSSYQEDQTYLFKCGTIYFTTSQFKQVKQVFPSELFLLY